MYAWFITFNLEPENCAAAERQTDRFAPILMAHRGLVIVAFFANNAADQTCFTTVFHRENGERRSILNILLSSIFIFMLLLLSACSSTTYPTAGTYETTIAEADIPVEFPAEFTPFMIGKWNVQLEEEGAFAVSKDGYVVSEGKYKFTSDQLVISDEKGEMVCIDLPDVATGTYQYEFNESGLKLTTV